MPHVLSFRRRRGLSQSLGPLSGGFCRRLLKLNEVKHLDVFDFEGDEVVGVSWFLEVKCTRGPWDLRCCKVSANNSISRD